MTPLDLGTVTLTGAGPGSADLLTVRAVRAIEGAQALLYDALVPDEIIALAPRGCVRLLTGKRAGKASMAQEAINRLMLKLARRGLRVVRLKGGDPSIFGRSGEEKAFLNAHGVQVEIIPGVTAASAAAAQFGFPLTHRGEARRLLISTARVTDGGLLEDGWAAGADPQTTLALYMGRDQAGAVAAQLIGHGRSPATPAVAVENAGRPDARPIAAMLGNLAEALTAARPEGPVVLLIGAVTAQADLAATLFPALQQVPIMNDTRLFDFESDFVATLRCVPMAVRFKLDRSGIKLTLRQWSRFTPLDRRALLGRPCDTPTEVEAYRLHLVDLIAVRASELAKPLTQTPDLVWEQDRIVPSVVVDYALSIGSAPPNQAQWAKLTILERFVLTKLTRDNHDNINFVPAMIEFGLHPRGLSQAVA